jgi:hypothetical protein
MTQNTTFKEFVEERGLNFSLLGFDSPEHEELAAAFNKAKLALIEGEITREHEEDKARIALEERKQASEELRRRRAKRARKSKSLSAQL